MKAISTVTGVSAVIALLTAQAAHASDTVYLGDCARASAVLSSSTIDMLLPHRRYEGVQRMKDTITTDKLCSREQVLIDTLTQKSRSA